MRWPALLLALLLAFVGTSTRHDAAGDQGSGLNAPVSAVHGQATASPDACWALCGTATGPHPPRQEVHTGALRAVHLDTTFSGPWSSRAPPGESALDSTHP